TSMPTVANFGANQLSIFPNPAVDVIRFQGLPMGVSVVSIYRLDGMLVFSGEVDAKSPMLNVGGLAAGSYLVRANGLTSKLVKR
ncbi:T9SS type A sorting domain-containing protein, partial [Porphyromonas loveana]